jgi:lipooligosaccharide transport system ATP-binding protein
VPGDVARARARKLVAQFGLSDKANDQIESLSGGLRRRLQVARALVSDPKVLVLDEPTTGLDPDARRVVWEVLTDARERGAAILLSTHYMDEAERLCDRIALLSKGQLLDLDKPARLIERHVGSDEVAEEVRPGVVWKRAPNLEDVFLKLAGHKLDVEAA